MHDQLEALLNNLVTERNRAAENIDASREMALCLTKLDEAIMWASAAKTIIQINAEVANPPQA